MLIAGLSVALGCAACGFKGPLYLPGRSAAVVTRPAPATEAAPKRTPAAARPGHKDNRAGAAQGGAGGPD
jgi:predicted small lipoprotein YifL